MYKTAIDVMLDTVADFVVVSMLDAADQIGCDSFTAQRCAHTETQSIHRKVFSPKNLQDLSCWLGSVQIHSTMDMSVD